MKITELFLEAHETESYLRFRQINPDEFSTLRIITFSKKDGIKAIVGYKDDETESTIQSILFDKSKWDEGSARAWLKSHDYRVTKPE